MNTNPNQDLQANINNLSNVVSRLAETIKAQYNKTTSSTDNVRKHRQNGNFSSNVDFSQKLSTQVRGAGESLGAGLNKVTLGVIPALTKGISGVGKATFGMITGVGEGIGKIFTGNIMGGIKDIFTNILSGAKNIVGSLFTMIDQIAGNIYSFVKNILTQAFSKFMEMQRMVGNLAADIGLSKDQSKALLLNFTQLATTAMEFGGEMNDIVSMIATFSEVTGKNKLFSNEDVENIEKIGRGTGLGVEGLTKLVAEFNNLGISLNKTTSTVEKARVESSVLGLNTKKVLETYGSLVTSLTGFQMKSGLNNMVKLAEEATQLRMDLTGVAEKMSESFFQPENAVETAAKMQVLGGQFAEKFGDAFELMYKAQNTPEEFLKDLMDMTKGLGRINEKGLFYMPPASMQLLREAANNLGVNFEQLKNGVAEQTKLADKIGSLSKNGILFKNDDDKKVIANLLEYNEEKKGYQFKMPDGQVKLLSESTQSMFDSILKQKQADADAAKSRMSFTDKLSTMWNRIQMSFTQVWAQVFDKLENSGFMDTLSNMTNTFINFIIPKIKDIFSDGGKMNSILTDVFKKITQITQKVYDIFTKDGVSFWDKVKSGLVSLIKGVWDLVMPYLEIATAKLLIAIGKATGFDSITRMGQNGLLSVANNKSNKDNKTIQDLTGSQSEKQKYAADKMEHKDDFSLNQMIGLGKGAGIGGAIGAGAGLITGIVAGIFSGGAGLALIPELMTAGAQIGAGVGGYAGMQSVDDALMTPEGRVFKGGKGDIGVLFDQAGLSNNSGGGSGKTEISHSGTITVKSENGKEITISDLEHIGRYTLATYLDSIKQGSDYGSNFNNSKMRIAPISK